MSICSHVLSFYVSLVNVLSLSVLLTTASGYPSSTYEYESVDAAVGAELDAVRELASEDLSVGCELVDGGSRRRRRGA